jgi:hypothetical protein
MFAVIILFQLKQGKENTFRSAWKSLTELIYQHEGSLGSRLHKADQSTYIAYAQWPDKKIWIDSDNLPELAHPIREQLRACCERIEIKYELEIVEDLLTREVFTEL